MPLTESPSNVHGGAVARAGLLRRCDHRVFIACARLSLALLASEACHCGAACASRPCTACSLNARLAQTAWPCIRMRRTSEYSVKARTFRFRARSVPTAATGAGELTSACDISPAYQLWARVRAHRDKSLQQQQQPVGIAAADSTLVPAISEPPSCPGGVTVVGAWRRHGLPCPRRCAAGRVRSEWHGD